MQPTDFKEANIKIAEDQEEYITLPAFLNKLEGSVTYAFKLSPEEVSIINKTGILYFKQFTGGSAMQPIQPTVIKDEVIPDYYG